MRDLTPDVEQRHMNPPYPREGKINGAQTPQAVTRRARPAGAASASTQHPVCPGILDDTIDRQAPVVPDGAKGLVSEPTS